MVGRDDRYMQEVASGQSSSPQDNWIDQVNNVGLKLVQATHKEWSKEIKFEFWIKRERQSSCADYFGSSEVIHTAIWAEQYGLVPICLQVFQQSDERTSNAV